MKDEAQKQLNSGIASLYEWVGAVSAALVAVALIFMFLCRVVSVDGTSMNNTLAHGERLLLSRLPYTPAYGDIVVLQLEGRQEPLIKRVIALGGDTIWVDPATGEVHRNGTVLTEAYIDVPTAAEQMTEAVVVPEGYVFVMGDNRVSGGSLDSRTFGCVPAGDILGKTVFRILPADRFGGIYDQP